ncbi:uncharacterized protein LOC6549883 [Drosophila erecta]|uniref:C2H2-type domain-containing protein n=1 Tax=Drosophila erecta TaxID=7220 RepID=B3NYA9_DROER|nr:uncharacterized protein LOC6549883 [Drosophila erecta]EDV47588.2 uncharacterized protein Dere_GG17556 [Drosophila erecta]
MQSMLSNRYNSKRSTFYERYEAARKRHPSLPEYERPVEPTTSKLSNFSVHRRHRYRQLIHQSREQLENDSWLSSNRLPIVVRHNIELRNNKLLMSRYNAETATHEFSHNGKPRRGRPPTAATAAKLASEFAIQVGGISQNLTDEDESQSESDVESMDKVADKMPDKIADKMADKVADKKTGKVEDKKAEDSEVPDPINITVERVDQNQGGPQPSSMSNANQAFTPNWDFSSTLSAFPISLQSFGFNWAEHFNAISSQYYNHIVNSVPFPGQVQPFNPTPFGRRIFGVNPSMVGGHPPFRVYSCPMENCKENFDSRRAMYKHQRETGHHTWSHNCGKCGQVFRTEGFKRMHSSNACERNLSKFKIAKPNEPKPRTKPE